MQDLIPDVTPYEKRPLEPPEDFESDDYDDDYDEEDQLSLQSLLISSYSFYQ